MPQHVRSTRLNANINANTPPRAHITPTHTRHTSTSHAHTRPYTFRSILTSPLELILHSAIRGYEVVLRLLFFIFSRAQCLAIYKAFILVKVWRQYMFATLSHGILKNFHIAVSISNQLTKYWVTHVRWPKLLLLRLNYRLEGRTLIKTLNKNVTKRTRMLVAWIFIFWRRQQP